MMRFLLGVLAAIFLASAGFFAFYLGVCLTAGLNEVGSKTALVGVAGLAVFGSFSLLLFRALTKLTFRQLAPLSALFGVCMIGGALYEQIRVPEGFRLIGLFFVLIIVGWIVARNVRAKLNTTPG